MPDMNMSLENNNGNVDDSFKKDLVDDKYDQIWVVVYFKIMITN